MRLKRSKFHLPKETKPNEIAVLLNEALKKLSTTIAQRLSRIEAKLTTRQKITAISLFCLIMFSYSMTLFYRGIFNKPNSEINSLKTKHITPLRDPQLPDSILYKKYLRSQGTKDTSSPKIDSITNKK